MIMILIKILECFVHLRAALVGVPSSLFIVNIRGIVKEFPEFWCSVTHVDWASALSLASIWASWGSLGRPGWFPRPRRTGPRSRWCKSGAPAARGLKQQPQRDALASPCRMARPVGRGGLKPGTENWGASSEARVKGVPELRYMPGRPPTV
jgi:hypothetical protein